MNFIRKNQLLERHLPGSQRLRQHLGLFKGNIPVVIAVNQQHGTFPAVYCRQRRRIERQPLLTCKLLARLRVSGSNTRN